MKNTSLITGIIGVAIVGGLIYYGINDATPTDDTSTSTPSTAINAGTTNVQAVGAPLVSSSPNVTTSEFAASISGTVTPRGLFTNYWFEYGLTDSLGSKTTMQNIGSGYSALTAPGYISGLQRNTKYFFRLVAENQYGKTAGVQYTFTTNPGNPAPVGGLPAIHTLSSTGISRTSANLNGDVNPNQASTVYWFEYGRTPDMGNTTSFQTISETSSKTNISLPITNLEPSTNYYFRLNAQNQWGTVNGVTLTFKTSGPANSLRPTTDTNSANNIKASTANLRGTVNPNGTETVYWFEYSTDSLLGSVLLKSTDHKSAGPGTKDVSVNADVSGLVSNTNYFYRVVAENSVGISYGDRVAFKTSR